MMDRRILTMLLVLTGILVGGALGVAIHHVSPQTQQWLTDLPLWAGPLAGLVGGVTFSGIAVGVFRWRRRRKPT